ncbi:unnamed protein product, partial [Ectocarpus sp. 13 AM-2016]
PRFDASNRHDRQHQACEKGRKKAAHTGVPREPGEGETVFKASHDVWPCEFERTLRTSRRAHNMRLVEEMRRTLSCPVRQVPCSDDRRDSRCAGKCSKSITTPQAHVVHYRRGASSAWDDTLGRAE